MGIVNYDIATDDFGRCSTPYYRNLIGSNIADVIRKDIYYLSYTTNVDQSITLYIFGNMVAAMERPRA